MSVPTIPFILDLGVQYVTLDATTLDQSYLADLTAVLIAHSQDQNNYEEINRRAMEIIAQHIDWQQVNNIYRTSFTFEQISQISGELGQLLATDLGDIPSDLFDRFNLDVTVANGYITRAEYSTNFSGMPVSGHMTFSDFNQSFTVNFPATNDSNSICLMTLQGDDIQVWLHGKKLNFPADSRPILRDDRTMLPARFLIERMGGTVTWEEETQTVVANLNGNTVRFSIGNRTAYLGDDSTVEMDVAPFIEHGRTLVPLRFMSEALGKTVNYDFRNIEDHTVLRIYID
jgi:hypothetical protein